MKAIVQPILRSAGIGLDGRNPWDIKVNSPLFYLSALRGSVGLGNAYVKGLWDCDRLDEFFCRLIEKGVTQKFPSIDMAVFKLRSMLSNPQTVARSFDVGKEHYDLPPEYFELVLGPTMMYTCARFPGVKSLNEAQLQKNENLCRKMYLKAGDRVWDIGFGWGGHMDYSQRYFGTECVGSSVSEEQWRFARKKYGNNKKLEFLLQDYRSFTGRVKHVVSICMIEQVGPKNLRTYFKCVRKAMADDGKFGLQAILARHTSSSIDPWTERNIFPGGVLPTVEQILDAAEAEGLYLLDREEFPDDYDRTLMAWHENLETNRDRIIKLIGETQYRKQKYYLLSCAGAFRAQHISVGQFIFSPRYDKKYKKVHLPRKSSS